MRAAVVAMALIFAVGLLAPKLIKHAGLREQLVTQLGTQLGAQVELATVDVSLLPLPHVVLDHLRLSAPPLVDAHIESVVVYPGLRALLTGRLQFTRVVIAGANVQLRVKRDAAVEVAPRSDSATQGLRQAVAAALANVASVAATRAPGLAVQLTHGAVMVTPMDGPPVSITDIEGTIHLPPAQLRLDLAARSNLWEQATLQSAIDPDSLRGDARLVLTGLRPQLLDAHLLPAGLEIGDAAANLSVGATANGLAALHVDVEATAASLPLRRAAEQLTLQGVHVNAGASVDGQNIAVTLNDVRLSAPPVRLSGTLVLGETAPPARLEIEGKDFDVAQTHAAAIFFAGPNPTARAIFDVLHAGTVPRLTLQAQGNTLGELATSDAMLIRGALVGGQVRVPGNGLELADVSGEVSVVKGVLIGEHAAGRVGNTRAHDGSVRVGLTDESRELSVSTAVQADVSDLPAVLKQVVANDTLTRTLDRVADLQGRAEGQLTLRGTTDAATAAVDVSQLNVSARLRDLGQPVQIEGEQFHYDSEAIAATDLAVTSGGSTMSAVSLHVDTRAAPSRLDVSTGSGRIALDEVFPWVAASGWLPESAWTPKTLAGTLAVESVHVRGPVARPSDWRVELAAAAERLDLDAPRLRQVVAVRFPVTLSDLRLAHDAAATTLAMGVTAADGLRANLNVGWGAAGLDIKRLSLRDANSSATLSLQLKEREFDMTFAGSLDTSTLRALFPDEHDIPRSMRGDFSARILMDQPARSTARVGLKVIHLTVPGPGDLKMHVAHADLRATGGMLAIDAAGDVGDGQLLHLHGALRPATDALVADLDVSAGQVEWARLAPLLSRASGGDGQRAPTASPPLRLRGNVRVTAESFSANGYTWQPVRAVVNLSSAAPVMTITQANLCRITMPGKIAVTPDGVNVHFKPAVANQPLDQMVRCLFGRSARMTGQCNLSAQVDAAGKGSDMLTSAHGLVQLSASKGRIYQGGVIEKILAVTSLGHGSWNILADLTDDGLPYNAIDVKGDLRDGKLVLTEATMDAPSMKMVGEGTIDMNAGTIDVTLLAAPLKTVDTAVSRIPILGSVLGGSLLTIPIKVKGPLHDPSVTPLDPSEVGSGLLRVMTRIVKLPLQLLNPFLPADSKPR